MTQKKTTEKDEFKVSIAEQDAILLETLIASPVFGALKRTLETYRKVCLSVLTTSKDTPMLFETQGRIMGINIIENLPGIIVAQRKAKLAHVERESLLKSKVSKPKQS